LLFLGPIGEIASPSRSSEFQLENIPASLSFNIDNLYKNYIEGPFDLNPIDSENTHGLDLGNEIKKPSDEPSVDHTPILETLVGNYYEQEHNYPSSSSTPSILSVDVDELMKGYVEKDFFNSLSESLNCIKSDEVSVDDTPILKVLVASPSSSSPSISSVDVNEVMKDYYVDADLSKKEKRKRNNKASRKLRAAKKKKHEDMQKACETLGNEQVALKQTIEKMNIEQKCTFDTVKLN